MGISDWGLGIGDWRGRGIGDWRLAIGDWRLAGEGEGQGRGTGTSNIERSTSSVQWENGKESRNAGLNVQRPMGEWEGIPECGTQRPTSNGGREELPRSNREGGEPAGWDESVRLVRSDPFVRCHPLTAYQSLNGAVFAFPMAGADWARGAPVAVVCSAEIRHRRLSSNWRESGIGGSVVGSAIGCGLAGNSSEAGKE